MKLRLPHLTPIAKAQLWGIGVGLGTALLAVEHTQVGYRIFFIGSGGAWLASEMLFGASLIARAAADKELKRSQIPTLAIAIFSGIAIPWTGFAIAFLLNALAP